MSKDKAGKKDKLKRLDLFEMMLNQSQVFRDMVEQFQSAWVPRNPSVTIEAGLATRRPVEEPTKAAKAAHDAKPAKKRASRKTTAAAKPAPTAVKKSSSKSAGKAKATAGSNRPKSATPRKTAAKAVSTRRVAKKK